MCQWAGFLPCRLTRFARTRLGYTSDMRMPVALAAAAVASASTIGMAGCSTGAPQPVDDAPAGDASMSAPEIDAEPFDAQAAAESAWRGLTSNQQDRVCDLLRLAATGTTDLKPFVPGDGGEAVETRFYFVSVARQECDSRAATNQAETDATIEQNDAEADREEEQATSPSPRTDPAIVAYAREVSVVSTSSLTDDQVMRVWIDTCEAAAQPGLDPLEVLAEGTRSVAEGSVLQQQGASSVAGIALAVACEVPTL